MAETPAAMSSCCNGEPQHAFSAERGANCPIWVRRCTLCGEIDWQDLINEAAALTVAAGVDEVVIRSQERAACEQELQAWRERAETAERRLEQQRLAYNAANAMAGVHKHRADRLKTDLEHAKGALAGDSEAMAAFMADHAKVVQRHYARADMWQREAEKAEAAIDRVHEMAQKWRAQRPLDEIDWELLDPTQGHRSAGELILAALDDTEGTENG